MFHLRACILILIHKVDITGCNLLEDLLQYCSWILTGGRYLRTALASDYNLFWGAGAALCILLAWEDRTGATAMLPPHSFPD